MSNIGRKRFQKNYSSADDERNEKRVHKRPNTGRKGRYSAKNKSAWPDLLQSLDSQLLENKISYLNKPSEVEAIKAKVPDPKFFAFIPSLNKRTEEPHEKEIRDMKNDVVKKLYTDALSRQISKLEQLQRDNEVRLAILLDLVDKAINDELHDYKKRTCASMNPEQQFESIFQHLLMTHGPHSSLDVRSLTAQLSELSPTNLGWPKFLLSFNHYVTTLT
jgi:hypothetical protein